MEKYKGKYRNESRRLRGWDYARNGLYFITFNTYDRACLFGDIVNGKMILNDFGKIATNEWFRSFEMRDELFLDEFILMPNHLHAIVGLESGGMETIGTVETAEPVGTHGRASLQIPETEIIPETTTISNQTSQNKTIPNNKTDNRIKYQPQPFKRKPKSISSFLAGYKSAVLNKIDDYIDDHQLPIQKFNRRNPLWQANYYDHIIRDGQTYERIAEYIRNNPMKWEKQKIEL